MSDFITGPDGNPKYTNRLKDATSPYLKQHAHNPVHWYPWGKEALEKARKEDKPILLSIGYSTCYWCHVMEREVFSDEKIAEQMNTDFINIKVDREERPDIDDIYMLARQILTREGGWPNNVFLTPELKPFFAGGTFAKDRRYGRMGFPEILSATTGSWQHRRDELEDNAEQITQRIRALLSGYSTPQGDNPITRDIIAQHVDYLKNVFDPQDGGFHHAPKFPHETFLLFLLDYHAIAGDEAALQVVTRSLDAMAAGGIFDHVGGGFHRYAVDEKWRVPHFEKMLYNQALMALAYTGGFEATGNPYYEYITRSTLDFVLGSMTSSKGGFYSAFDAETDAVEGAYYVWSRAEINQLLSSGAQNIFYSTYSLEELPQFPGHKHAEGKVLYANKPIPDAATDNGLPYDAFQLQLDKILGKLLLTRQQRKAPMLDNKIITSWNGLMIEAFAQAGYQLDEGRYITAAERAADFILSELTDRSFNLLRIWHKGIKETSGYLEDYAYFTKALITLYAVTKKDRWLEAAVNIINRADDLFLDKSRLSIGQAGFFAVPEKTEMIVRIKTADDGALPAANAVMVHCLTQLARLTQNTEFASEIWEKRAFETIHAFAERILTSPQSYTHMLHGRMLLMALHRASNDNRSAALSGNPSTSPLSIKSPNTEHYVRISTEVKEKHIVSGKPFTLLVTLHIAQGWHINASSVNDKNLIPTSVKLKGPNVTVKKIGYPSAITFTSEVLGTTLPAYTGVITIIIEAKLEKSAAAGEIEDMQLLVQMQACNETLCLAPVSALVEIPTFVSGNSN